MTFKWDRLGRILVPKESVDWMSTWVGASFARQVGNSSKFEIFVTGRDDKNRSRVGKVYFDIEKLFVEKIGNVVFNLGDLGAFDENGVSYPWLYYFQGKWYMLYVGWKPTVLTPFQNGLGLAVEQENGLFKRVSRAPILPFDNDDYLSIGSSSVFIDNDVIRLYYTSFLRWGNGPDEAKHYYVIKYAESKDGINWTRNNHICINSIYGMGDFSICRPSVIKLGDTYHMWFSYRGENYSLGYAYSKDGINWTRDDSQSGISKPATGWDSEMQCYCQVFQYGKDYYMIYCGNKYGKDGLGIAKLMIEQS